MTSPAQTASLGSGLTVLVLAPMVAHMTWRPAAVALGSTVEGTAPAVSVAAVAVAALAAWLSLRPRRLASGVVVPAALALGLLVGGAAGVVSLLGVGLCALLVRPGMHASLRTTLEATPPPSRVGLAVWCVVVLGCLVGSVSLATYFGDPWAEGYGLSVDAVIYRHFCASAYLHAAELVHSGVANVYDLSLVPPGGELPASAAHMAPFELDRYGYPPQFLLIPLALIAVVGDFAAQRAVWTCTNALLFAAVLWRGGLWVGPRSGRTVRALAPVLWLLGGVTFQVGNIQLSILVLSLLAMMAFDERRDRVGGALLAGVTLAKIAPGLLGVLLLARQRWLGVGWTVGFAVLFSALALLVMGPGVFVAFLEYHLPMVSSGEAYSFLDDNSRLIYENLSPFGIPFKLAAMGAELDPWVWGPRVVGAYTVLAFVLAAVAGRRVLDRRGLVAVWALVLTVASLRSPMAPGYMLAGVLLALALVGAEVRTAAGWALGVGLVLAMTLTTPFFAALPLWVALAGQAIMHGAIVWLMLRRWPVLDEALQPHALGGAEGEMRPGRGGAGLSQV